MRLQEFQGHGGTEHIPRSSVGSVLKILWKWVSSWGRPLVAGHVTLGSLPNGSTGKFRGRNGFIFATARCGISPL